MSEPPQNATSRTIVHAPKGLDPARYVDELIEVGDLEGLPSRRTRRVGEAAPTSPVFTAAEPATGTDGKGSVAGSGRSRGRSPLDSAA